LVIIMKPFLLGIAGPSCSGKSTVAQTLKSLFPDTVVVSLDNYWTDSIPSKDDVHVGDPQGLNFDLLVENLKELAAGQETDGPVRSQAGSSLHVIKPVSLVIVEGVLLFYDSRVCALFDMKVYLDVPVDVIVKRMIARSHVAVHEVYYAQTVAQEYHKYGIPMSEKADLVVDALVSPSSTAYYIADQVRKRRLRARRGP